MNTRLPDSLPSAIRSERRSTLFMGVCVRVDGRRWRTAHTAFGAATAARRHGGPTKREAGANAAARAPGVGAVIPERSILTDPHSLLTRPRANLPYSNAARRVPQCNIATPETTSKGARP